MSASSDVVVFVQFAVVSGGWPLVGRSEELAFVARALRNRGVFISGAVGVGKSRLAREAAEQAGRNVVSIVATSAASSIPFGALSGVISLDDVASAPSKLELLIAATDRLREHAASGIVWVDDAHLLDDASADVVHRVATSGTAKILVTVRAGEAAPDAVTSLWKDVVLERLELQGLSEPESGSLVEALLEGQVERFAVTKLWSASQGNPLFLREIVWHARDRGALVLSDGVWRLRGDLTVGPRVSALLGDRLRSVPEEVYAALELAAFGEPIPVDVVSRCASADAAVEAERRELLSVERDGGRLVARPAHPLYGEVVRETTGALRARAVREALADAVEQSGMRRQDDVLRVAMWRLDGENPAGAALLRAAASRAGQLFDHRLMVRLASAAWRSEPSFANGLVLSKALSLSGARAERLELMTALAPLASNDDERADLAIDHATTLSLGVGRDDDAQLVLADAEERLENPHHRFRLRGMRAVLLALSGECGRAIEEADAVLGAPDAGDEARLRSLRAKAFAAPLVGRFQDALDTAAQGFDEGQRSGWALAETVGWFWSARIQALWLGGWLASAYDEAVLAVDLSASFPSVTVRATARMWLGQVLLTQGRVGESLPHLHESVAMFREEDAGSLLPRGIAELAHALALTDKATDAQHLLDSSPSGPRGGAALNGLALDRARAWAQAAAGDVIRARRVLSDVAGAAHANSLVGAELLMRDDAFRLGADEEGDAILRLAARHDGPLAPIVAEHVAARRTHDGGALDAVAARFAELPAYLHAAEAATEARVAHQHAGATGRAGASAARAAEWLALTGGARTPVLALTTATDPLTAREREIARMVAAGLTNRDIADTLVVSVRTVESHIYRACAKLGVTDRRELAEIVH